MKGRGEYGCVLQKSLPPKLLVSWFIGVAVLKTAVIVGTRALMFRKEVWSVMSTVAKRKKEIKI